MQKKHKLLLGGASTVAVVAGVALTGGTSAYYYDLERSEGNKLSACSLDLVEQGVTITQTAFGDENGQAGSQAQTGSVATTGGLSKITLEKLVPGDKFDVNIDLVNNGSCAGEMWGDVNFPITDLENENPDAETAPGVPNPDPNGGDLDDVIKATYNGPSDDGISYSGDYRTLANFWPYLLDSDFQPGETNTVSVTLEVPDDGTATDGNEIMGDSFTFALDFAAAQKNKINPRNNGVGKNLNDLSTLNNS